MPVIKSVFKNVRVNARKRLVNLRTKETFKSQIKEFNHLVVEKKIKEAEAILPKVYKALDMAAKKRVISANSAARKKSSLTKKLKTA